jgi:energy-coupling factor transporter ATP-binding protein EcfA2
MALAAEHLSFAYAPESMILHGFSAKFPQGQITAITGPNGCGKTTLAKLLTGILKPSSGRVTLDDQDMSGMTLTEIGRKVGLVMQNPERQMFCTSVRDEIEFGLKHFGFAESEIADRRDRYAEAFGLSRLLDRFPFALSGGEKQRVMLAAILAADPSFLILDAPTSALDRGRRRVLGRILQKLKDEENVGIILISHDEAFITEFADERMEMNA